MSAKKVEPFGLWKSPISPVMVSQRKRFNDVRFDSDGKTLVWLEGRSDRGVLVAREGREASRDLTDEQSVSGGIGYGGGEFTVSQGRVFFADRRKQLLSRPLAAGRPHPVTPPFGSGAAPTLSPDGRWLMYVYSDGRDDHVAVVDAEGCDWPVKLTRGATFYMQPAWHPSGERIAWVEWDHPNMPWDGTRVMLARVEGAPPRIVETQQVAGDDRTPAGQPLFSPDGRWLSFVTGNGEWQDLVVMDLESGQKRVLVHGDGFDMMAAAWVQGVHSYGWSGSSQRLFYLRLARGYASLWVVELENGATHQIDTAPYTWMSQLSVSPARDEVAFLASAPTVPDRVVRWDGEKLIVEARSDPESIPDTLLPEAREINWKAADGTTVYGFYFAPKNPDFSSQGLPPAIVRAHGGPTGVMPAGYSSDIAYFTSRGYAWLEVNYRGSTTMGRSYQDMLREHWGPLDVEDVLGGSRAMVEQGLADEKRLVILGGSAGGYTVLNALVHHPGFFKAGVSLYGVSSLFTLAMDTHKFEERYTISLVGPLPEASARYHEWSPIYHAEKISDPMAIFQGAEDPVVVPVQSETMVEALRQRGIPHVYRLYPGEGHGFRKAETVKDYLETLEKFLVEYVVLGV